MGKLNLYGPVGLYLWFVCHNSALLCCFNKEFLHFSIILDSDNMVIWLMWRGLPLCYFHRDPVCLHEAIKLSVYRLRFCTKIKAELGPISQSQGGGLCGQCDRLRILGGSVRPAGKGKAKPETAPLNALPLFLAE